MVLDLLKYFYAFALGACLTYLLTPLAIVLGPRLRMMDYPDARRIHQQPTPRTGGLGIFLAFHLSVVVLYYFYWPPLTGSLGWDWWFGFLPSSLLLLLLGAVDDACGIKPYIKLAGQTVASLLFIFLTQAQTSELLGLELRWGLNWIFPLIWCLALINAFNLIDGMDGLCSGLALISALGLAFNLLFRGHIGDVLVLTVLVGCALGFLRYNFHPAKIFLGDNGSMFLGFTLAAVSLSTHGKMTFAVSLGIPLVAAGVPLADTLLAIWRRSVKGGLAKLLGSGETIRIVDPDKYHLHHRLLGMGLGQRKTAFVLYIVNALFVATGLLLSLFQISSLGWLLLMLLGVVYVVARHLIHVEIWETGRFLITGLQKPGKWGIIPMLLPILDLLWLGTALVTAKLIQNPGLLQMDKLVALERVVAWVLPIFVALFLSKCYSRLWASATFQDYAVLCLALTLGTLISVAMELLIDKSSLPYVIGTTLNFWALAIMGVLGVRTSVTVLREWMISTAKNRLTVNASPAKIVLLYGAGHRGRLYLRHWRTLPPETFASMHIAGFLDDNPQLHHRYSYGVKVLGGIEQLEEILAQMPVHEIIITTDLTPERHARLLKFSQEKGLSVKRWAPVMETIA